MPRLKIKGQVLDISGKKVGNARVEIYDTDVGSPPDLILTKTTNSDGEFIGTSREWRDDDFVDSPLGRVPAPDMLNLVFKITKGNEKHEGPFIHLADNLSVPIHCPWRDPDVVMAKVNGKACNDIDELASAVKQVLREAPNKIIIDMYDPALKAAFSPLVDATTQQALVTNANSSITKALPGTGVPEVFFILLGVAAIILAAGMFVSATLIGTAVLYAIAEGYQDITFEHRTEDGKGYLRFEASK